MKITRLLQLLLVVCLMATCFGCNQEGGKEEPTPELTPAERAEVAMGNFVKKLQAGNYTITGGQGATVNAASPEQVSIRFERDDDSFGIVFMTLKGETFETMLYDSDTEVSEVTFITTDNAIDTNPDMLPNGWIRMTDGNLFEVFYNDPNNPLQFSAHDEQLKMSVLTMAGYSQFALRDMEDVYLILDADDPKTAHIKAVVNDDLVTRIEYDDIDLTVEFGAGKSDSRVESWFKNPGYPAIRTGWTREDINTLEVVFFNDYGREAMPFPNAASHAMIFDPDAYRDFSCVILEDHNLSEKDVEDYKTLLKSKGFTEEQGTLIDGSIGTVYRHLLREEYKAYSQLYPYYDDGLVVIGTLYHEEPVYEGREAISAEVQKHGFAELPDTDALTGWKAVDTACSKSEGWLYYFDYDFYAGFTLQYEDREAAKTYLSSYADSLIQKGFVSRYTPGEDNRQVGSANDFVTFRYEFSEEEDTVYLEFKNQKCLSVDEVRDLLKQHGLPEIDIHGDIGARDVSRYYYEIGEFEGLRLNCYQPYDTIADAESYLDALIPVIEEQGYYSFNPQKVGSQRQFVWLNEELMKYVGFDVMETADGGQIFWEIVSFGSPDTSIQSTLLNVR